MLLIWREREKRYTGILQPTCPDELWASSWYSFVCATIWGVVVKRVPMTFDPISYPTALVPFFCQKIENVWCRQISHPVRSGGGGEEKKYITILDHTEMVNSGGVVGSPGTALMTGLIRIYKHLGVISSEGQRIDFLCQKRGLCVSWWVY